MSAYEWFVVVLHGLYGLALAASFWAGGAGDVIEGWGG